MLTRFKICKKVTGLRGLRNPATSHVIVLRLLTFAAALLAFVSAAPIVAASQTLITRHYTGKPQTDINVGIFSTFRKNCTAGPLPAIRLVTPPAHGKVTVKEGKLRARNVRDCLASDLPALVALYRSAANFVGQDTFTIELTGADGKSQLQRITVTISGRSQNEKDI